MSIEKIYSTGNAIVDENAKLDITGNIIPQAWYQTITRDNGKLNLTAIIILADIVYLYKPTEIRDEVTGQVVELKKKFKADLLQRSYQQISEQFGISKKEACSAIVFLELVVSRLRKLTYLEDVGSVPGPGGDQGRWKEPEEDRSETAEAGQSVYEGGAVIFQGERVSTSKEIPQDVKGETNIEIPQKNTTEIQSSKYYNPIQSYQSTEEQFKEQIDFDVIWIDRLSDRRLLENIVSIVVDVLTSTAGTIQINREDKPVPIVQILTYGG